MNKIKIGDKEYNCSNIVYYHIQGLDSKSRYLKSEVSIKDREIERLNNIINKLENSLVESNKYIDNPIFKEQLKYLQELKGSDKE